MDINESEVFIYFSFLRMRLWQEQKISIILTQVLYKLTQSNFAILVTSQNFNEQ